MALQDLTHNHKSILMPDPLLTPYRPPDLHPEPLMDMDFVKTSSLVRPGLPHIWFLFIGPRLCSTLPSDPTSR